MINIALVNIDNRPICYDIVSDILSINNNINLFMPDIELLGGLYSSSDIDGIFDFIKNLSDIDYFIIALDTIAYGGLVNSRRCDDSIDTIKKRIEKLKTIIPENSKILAFSSIMRISNNNINEEEKEYWSEYGKKIFEWSYNRGKEVLRYGGMNNYCANNHDTQDSIPTEILQDYLNTRKRNFEINKLYLELAQVGFFDTLIFSKDDCAEFGLNVAEAKALEYIIKRDNIKNAFIKTGADEIPLTLIARALAKKENIRIKPLFIESDYKNLISKYEDISIEKCVSGQLSLAGVEISDKADITLLINNFKNEQGDLVLGDIVNNINQRIDFPKTPYVVADVNNANGADCNFIKQLFSQDIDIFYGYCAYNTSANTLGSSILTAIVKYLAIKNNSYNDSAFKKLQFIRFLDDWSYQARHRKHVRKAAPEFQQGLDDIIPELNLDGEKISEFLKYYPKKISYSLPWNRSFEIRIEVL